jgi:hypothetical protein
MIEGIWAFLVEHINPRLASFRHPKLLVSLVLAFNLVCVVLMARYSAIDPTITPNNFNGPPDDLKFTEWSAVMREKSTVESYANMVTILILILILIMDIKTFPDIWMLVCLVAC